jgi:hypothetical protein
MPIRRPLLALASSAAAALAAAFAAPAADAAWFPAQSIEGPSADVRAVADVDLARDGTGGLVYLKREAGVTHAYLSRVIDGAWQPAERVDPGLGGEVTAATVAAGDGRRLAIAFVSDGRLYGTASPGGGQGALSAPQPIGEGTPAAPQTGLHADLGINGTAYVVSSFGGDVRAVRLQGMTWEAVPAPIDVEPGRAAGDGTGRPRVAVSAEGNAVAVWGEDAPDGRRRVFGRRITGLVPSAAPQELSLPDLGGAAGGRADSPDIDVEDDGSYAWAVFRQDIGGVSRAISRRLVGSLFEAPTAVDGGGPADAPRIELNGRGIGFAVAAGAGATTVGALIDKLDAYRPPERVDTLGSAAPTAPAVAVSERRQVAVGWRRDPGGGAPATLQVRYRPDELPFEAETTVSVPEYGTVAGGPELSTTKNGDVAVAFLQGPEGARRVVAAVYDRLAAAPQGRSTTRFQRRSRPTLAWAGGSEVWGPQLFKVLVDGVEVATTAATRLTVPARLADGVHRWQAQAVDRRGQVSAGKDRLVRVDATPPVVRVRVTGRRRARRAVKVAVAAGDGQGSGVGTIRVDYGDRTPAGSARATTHRYRRGGRYTVTVRASDRVRNVSRTTVRLRIAR